MIGYIPSFGPAMPVGQQITRGLDWLRAQPGRSVVVSGRRRSVVSTNDLELRRRTPVVDIAHLQHSGVAADAVLVAWPERELLERFTPGGGLLDETVSIGVMEWGAHNWMSDWLAAHGAVDATTGAGPILPPHALLLPDVHATLEPLLPEFLDLDSTATAEHATIILRALRILLRGGHGFRADALWAWALAHRCPPERARLLLDLALIALSDARVTPIRGVGPAGPTALQGAGA